MRTNAGNCKKGPGAHDDHEGCYGREIAPRPAAARPRDPVARMDRLMPMAVLMPMIAGEEPLHRSGPGALVRRGSVRRSVVQL